MAIFAVTALNFLFAVPSLITHSLAMHNFLLVFIPVLIVLMQDHQYFYAFHKFWNIQPSSILPLSYYIRLVQEGIIKTP